jgi:FkbM family methyltransferase
VAQIGDRLSSLARPHYLFRPIQILRRVTSELRPSSEEHSFPLIWGSEITSNPRDPIGLGLLRRGVFDLLVCETLLRLSDPGETVIDAGANIGHMTSLLAHAVGPQGVVIAFEPHPQVFARLTSNAELWRAVASSGTIELNQAGLSDSEGTATLATDVFDHNQGSPSLEPLQQIRGAVDEHSVRIVRLDDALASVDRVGVMKMDIEGHEARALAGARELLASGRIRDIVFEEREKPPTDVTRLLESHGYAILQLGERLRGPWVAQLGTDAINPKDDPSLLATRDPARALARLAPRGWAVYGIGPAGRAEKRRRS